MDRETGGYAQMGGEGVPHVVASKFNGGKHLFQNLGEGTWYHSGSLAIRQAVAAQTNITYKILYNDAVAMTGGQPVDGPISVAGIAQTCRAEGVARVALVSDVIDKFARADFPQGTSFHPREEMDTVQRELREVKGVSVLIYEQTCATEKRRRRKRGQMEDPKRFAFINPAVCEGCGDCSLESNCLSIEPLETELGRKRKINLSSCNKDFSCLNGFCPSFVTLEGAVRRKKTGAEVDIDALLSDITPPALPKLQKPFDLLVTGVGGTGGITVGALITMAAHLEGKGSSVLDFTGFAQKFGTVLSFIRIGMSPDAIHQVRIDHGAADAVIGCDIVVSSAAQASVYYGADTKVVLNLAEMPRGDLVLHRDAQLHTDLREEAIRATVGAGNLIGFDANAMAERFLGDTVFANMMMLGFAWQKGLVPVSHGALQQAIVLNGVAIDKNHRAFDLGRIMAATPDALALPQKTKPSADSHAIIADRAERLRAYQNDGYAQRYVDRLAQFRRAIPDAHAEDLTQVAAKALYKLMAFKDEYEVARLHSDPAFAAQLEEEFEPGFKINYHMAPPIVSLRKDARGRPVKRAFGAWLRPVLSGLAKLSLLRGTTLDVFGYTQERREEVALIRWYEGLMEELPAKVDDARSEVVHKLLALPLDIRGFGPVKHAAVEAARVQELQLRAALE